MTQLSFNLHAKQMAIFSSKARFVVAACGRRFGKSYLAAVKLIIEGLKDTNEHGYPLAGREIWYVAPTFQQAKDIMWNLLKTMGADVIEKVHENTATITLINGRRIQLKGSDRPDTLRGVAVSFAVLDEYAFMKPEVWNLIIRPTLADVMGGALFIGTPDGKNHFYDLWTDAHNLEDWEAFSFPSTDNPTIPIKEEMVAAQKSGVPSQIIRQEYEASFISGGTGLFKESEIKYYDSAINGQTFILVDPAGYEEVGDVKTSALKRLDECAIAVVTVNEEGWYIEDIQHGRWGIREASLRIIRAAQQHHAACIGIEKGALKNAIMPYLEDQMRRLNVYPRIEPLTHGGKKKTERIMWALQGRFQNGKIYLKKGAWNKKFIDQLLDFPNPMSHDDLIDAVAYTDQLASIPYYHGDYSESTFDPLDPDAGY